MEILFENTHVRNKELAKELYGQVYFKDKLMLVCYIFIIACLIIGSYNLIKGNLYFLSVVIVAVLFIIFRICSYFWSVNRMVKNGKTFSGREIVFETVVTEDCVECTTSTGASNKVKFSNIKNAIETKNLFLLRTKADTAYIFRKDSFTKGTENEFVVFLRNKGIKITD